MAGQTYDPYAVFADAPGPTPDLSHIPTAQLQALLDARNAAETAGSASGAVQGRAGLFDDLIPQAQPAGSGASLAAQAVQGAASAAPWNNDPIVQAAPNAPTAAASDPWAAFPDAPSTPKARRLSLVGDTYTILISGADTQGRYCLIDMLVPDGGGPPPHRHDFEETFILIDGELSFTFRGATQTVKAPASINIPANAPHQFKNVSGKTAHILCQCAPAGQEPRSIRPDRTGWPACLECAGLTGAGRRHVR